MLERELKLAASPGFRVPDLGGPEAGFVAVAEAPRDILTTYFDTRDLRLARWGSSLRFRPGEGWTVKLSVQSEESPRRGQDAPLIREEFTFPGAGRRPPDEALDLVRAFVRSAALQPAARLKAVRRRVRLVGPEKETLGEVVDDEVSVLDGRHVAARFREVEVEIGEGSPAALIGNVATELRAAGAGAADPIPKYVRALGPRALEPPEVVVPELTAEAPAGEVVRRALAASVVRLLRHDAGVRVGEDPEEVHQARVATRRLRSDLRSFRSLIDAEWVADLRDELRWLGSGLGAVRDVDVMLARLRAGAEEIDAREEAAPVLSRLLATGRRRRKDLLERMRQERYVQLLDRLVEAAQAPKLLPDADGPAASLRGLVDGPWRRLKSAVDGLADPPSDVELHGVRIGAKRCRYLGEAVAPVLGRPARSFAKSCAGLQDTLGEHQDAVVAFAWLHEAGASLPPTRAFLAGQLSALQFRAAEDARAAWPKAWKAVHKKRPGTW
jgi:CHAD domain-containing protein